MIKFIKKCRIPVAILVITLAILFSLFRALTPWAKQYKGEVEQHLSALIGQPVTISTMETSWYWFEPVLKLNQVTVSGQDDQVLKLNKLLVGINLFSSLWHWEVQPGILYVDDAKLSLRQVDKRWQIDGLSNNQPMKFEPESYLPVLIWLLQQQKIIIKNTSIVVYLSDGTILPINSINVKAVNRYGHYRVKGGAILAQAKPTELSFLADMHADPYHLDQAMGQAYLSLSHFVPAQWQEFFPQSDFHLRKGQGDVELWLDLAKGQLRGLQTQFNFKHIVWNRESKPGNHLIKAVQANLAWKANQDGWEARGDQINLRIAGMKWPENKLVLDYNKSQNAYRFFVKNLLIEPILAADIDWPQAMHTVLAAHPEGELFDTQVEVKNSQVNYLITRFNNLSWQRVDNIPALNKLSGVLNWQPLRGRLDFDGENLILAPSELPAVTLGEMNGAFNWTKVNQRWQINMERFIVKRPDLQLSANGALDDPFSISGQIKLEADLVAENAQQWLAYLPQKHLKLKLYNWLTHDIKHIGKMQAQLRLNGSIADFPYDKQPGEFSIVSHISNLDMLINQHWPLSNDIEADLRFNKRNLEADVRYADLQGIIVNQMNLRMDDLGLDRETLLLHGKITAPADKMKSYVLATPLRTHLSKLKMVSLQGDVGVDLRLQIPLYPENDDVLARGVITFKDNEATVHHALNDILLQDLSGALEFDEHGITDSALQAMFLGDPVAMHIQSIRKKHPYTQVHLEGNTTIELLKSKFNLPIFSLLQGHLKIDSILTLTDDPHDLDHIKVTTSLQGVSIDLPAPFAKLSEVKAPLTIDVDFNPEKPLRIRFNYDNRLSSDLWFSRPQDQFVLQKGEVRLGKGQALWKNQTAVKVVGTLPAFDLAQWRKVIDKLPSAAASPRLIDSIESIDVTLGSLPFMSHDFKNVVIKASRITPDEWMVNLNEPDLVANLRYRLAANLLSGEFAHLYLPKPSQDPSPAKSALKPAQIPNLDVTINELKIGKVDIGTIALKSTSTATNWQLDSCKIKSPGYELDVKGSWKSVGTQDSTNLQADLKITDLAATLNQWSITPAVEAKKGDIQFTGGWSGPIDKFSLAKINGNVYIHFTNGQITHLSPEMEKKLSLGKLLSILSLQTIPRRLKLDFSDLSNNGYSFDEFKGSFGLRNGVMNTDDSYINGPVAYASMKGDLDLVKQLYDVDLLVSPHITASLPIVATIAGGPIAGVLTWFASKIINGGMQKISGYTYKVSGLWQDPEVKQVSIIKKNQPYVIGNR